MNTNQHIGQLFRSGEAVTQEVNKMIRIQGNMPIPNLFGKIVHVDNPCLFVHESGVIITIKEMSGCGFTQDSFVPVISTDELALELEQLNQVTV